METDNSQVMAAATTLSRLSSQLEEVIVFEGEICNAGVTRARGEAGILYESGRLPLAGNVGRSRLGELTAVLQFKRHAIVHEAMCKVDESSVAPEHGGEGVPPEA